MFLNVRRVLGRRSEAGARHRGRHLFGEGPPAPAHRPVDAADAAPTAAPVEVDLRGPEPVIELGLAGAADEEVATVTPALPPQPNLRAPGEMWHPTIRSNPSEPGSLSAFGLPYPAEDRVSWRELREEAADPRRGLSVGSAAIASTRVAWDRLVDGTAPRARYGLGPAEDLYAASEERLAEIEAEQRRGARPHRPHPPRRGGLFGSTGPAGGAGGSAPTDEPDGA